MGVAGSGKSSLGKALGLNLGLRFFDADAFHSPQAIARMGNGQPLREQERTPWLQRLQKLLREQPELVLACSALKQTYRAMLREAAPDLRICYLKGDFDAILLRLEARKDQHFFCGAAMLRSQFDCLEEPQTEDSVLVIPITLTTAQQVAITQTWTQAWINETNLNNRKV